MVFMVKESVRVHVQGLGGGVHGQRLGGVFFAHSAAKWHKGKSGVFFYLFTLLAMKQGDKGLCKNNEDLVFS